MQRHRVFQAVLALALIAVVASCAPANPPQPVVVIATKTPKPTFTPTVAVTPTRLIIPTATQPATAAPTQAAATATPEATAVPPTATPQPSPQFAANQNMNVRQGPGTAYPVVGQLNAGDQYKVSGKNQDGSWLQFNYNGDPGWVSATLVTFTGDANSVQVAQNIPAPPPPPPTARPVPTQPPAPTAPPAPPPSRYKYKNATVSSCRPQAGGTWFNGTVTLGGQAVDGALVVFSWAPDGTPITNPMLTGPHPGYPGWNHGYYSHIIKPTGPSLKGDWYVWIIENGARVSEIAHWHSDGSVPAGTGCNDATVDFSG